ncbi:hypothetical protein HMPREF1316_0818 [Olsenella profusa F0195]|uniref:Uncharacterized protein n=1 Tax=Olsenella profusa F0195 TaxID=1125712 RepID=U2UZZ8_9ACTN|nr:hypothetical protein HMPREF1316_0818 [Olsenella profusa F0195]
MGRGDGIPTVRHGCLLRGQGYRNRLRCGLLVGLPALLGGSLGLIAHRLLIRLGLNLWLCIGLLIARRLLLWSRLLGLSVPIRGLLLWSRLWGGRGAARREGGRPRQRVTTGTPRGNIELPHPQGNHIGGDAIDPRAEEQPDHDNDQGHHEERSEYACDGLRAVVRPCAAHGPYEARTRAGKPNHGDEREDDAKHQTHEQADAGNLGKALEVAFDHLIDAVDLIASGKVLIDLGTDGTDRKEGLYKDADDDHNDAPQNRDKSYEPCDEAPYDPPANPRDKDAPATLDAFTNLNSRLLRRGVHAPRGQAPPLIDIAGDAQPPHHRDEHRQTKQKNDFWPPFVTLEEAPSIGEIPDVLWHEKLPSSSAQSFRAENGLYGTANPIALSMGN